MELNLNFILLILLIFIAGFVDSIAGGGGIITIPAYLNFGISENLILGTNKLSSTMGTTIAVLRYFNEIRFSWKLLLFIFINSSISSFLGAYFISGIPQDWIRIIIITLLPPLSFYLTKTKNFGIKDYSIYLDETTRYVRIFIISSTVSFYDGLMGPGTGTFLVMGYSKYVGYDILKGTVLAKFTNLVSNISALITFLILKRVDIELGFFMGLISILGNFLGANLALKKGIWIIRPLLIIVSNLIIIKILLDSFEFFDL